MGVEDQRTSLLSADAAAHRRPPPEDDLHLAYAVYFILGAGFLLPWNAFITAVDYFAYLYPAVAVDRVFSVAYMGACLLPLLLIVGYGAHRSRAPLRINAGLALYTASLLVVPVVDALVVKGRREIYGAYDATVAAVVAAGIADALVQGGVIGAAGELPERYMQAVAAGTAASGINGCFFFGTLFSGLNYIGEIGYQLVALI